MTRPTRFIRQYPRPEAGGLDYDNTASGLDAETVQDAIDELAAESGAIAVTDGTTTVDPTTTIEFDPTYFDVTAPGGDVAEVTFVGSSGGVIVEDEGTPLTTTADTLNFTGAGVTASGSGTTKTIDIPGGAGGGALTYLGETVLGSAAATITATGISGSYSTLIVEFLGRSATANAKAFWMRVGNGSIDTGSNYGYYRQYNGTLGSGGDGSSSDSKWIVGAVPGSGSSAGANAVQRIVLPYYALSSVRRVMVSQGFETGSDGTLHSQGGGMWYSTSVIDQVQFLVSDGSNLDTGARIRLWGQDD